MTNNENDEKQAREQWIKKIQQGHLAGYQGSCMVCQKPFAISSARNEEGLVTTSLEYHERCLKSDHDPEIMTTITKALQGQPSLPWNKVE